MSGFVTPIPPYAFKACTGETLITYSVNAVVVGYKILACYNSTKSSGVCKE
jgi:hypothetical protein